MIEGFWDALPPEEEAAILADVTEKTGEEFTPGKVSVRRFYADVYDGWDAYRLRFDKQRSRNRYAPDRRKDIPEGAFSIVLINQSTRDVICLKNQSAMLYAANEKLGLRLSRDTLVPYISFFGQVVHAPGGPFHFISSMSQISDAESLTPEVVDRLQAAVNTLFHLKDDGGLNLNVTEKTYPVLGTVYSLDLPCIYAGSVFRSSLTMSGAGYPRMTDDNPLTVQDLDELNPVRFYHHIDNHGEMVKSLQRAERKLRRGEKRLVLPMLLEKVFGVLAFPIFAIFAVILWKFGASDPVMRAFFEKLPELGLLNWICALFGGVIILGALLRFLFFEVVRLSAKLVPNRYSMILNQAENQFRQARKVFGLIGFLLIALVEFIFVPIMGAVIFAYGALNILAERLWSFVDSTALVLSSFPVLPALGKWAFGLQPFDVDTAGTLAIAVKWGFSAFFGTVVIGVVSRIIAILLSRGN